MKKMILYLMLITCVFFSQFSFAANVDDDDEGEEIIIEYADPGESVNRGIIDIPFQVIYYNQQSCVTIAFTNYIGEITISLTNLLNSTSTNTVIDSTCGNYILPITSESGYYRIDLVTSNGVHYYGFFVVQ